MPETNLLGFTPTTGITDDIRKKSESFISNQGYVPSSNMFGDLGTTTSKKQPSLMDTINSQPIDNNIGGETGISRQDSIEQLSDGSYIDKFKDYYVGTDNNERLAQQQTLTEKWGNGAAKLGLKTATAVVGGTLGILDSLGTLMTTGSLSEAYNSNLNVWLDDVNKKLDYKLPNLYTQQDREAGLFGQMGQANFYADKLFGGMSFMAGAVVSEAIWSAATVATFGGTAEILALNTAKQAANAAKWSTKAFGAESKMQTVLQTAKAWAKMPSTSVLDEAGNVMRGLTRGEKQATILNYGIGKGADIIVPMMRSAGYESGMEARLYMKQTEEAWLDKYKETNGIEPSSEEYADFKDKLSDTGNLVFGANMAILSLSNYVQLKNTILGRTTDRTITNNSWSRSLFGKGFDKLEDGTLKAIDATKAQKIFGKVYGLGKGFVTEGQEEMSQSVFSGTGENYMLAEFDKDKTKASYGLMESFTDAVHKTYTTKEGLTEGLIGGLIGIMGGAAGGARRKFKGGEFFESEVERKEVEDAVMYSNEYTAKSLVNNIVASNKMMRAQELRDKAEANNDISGQKTAEAAMSMLRIQRDNSIGGLDEGLKDYAREVNALDTEFIKGELGFTTLEEVNKYKDSLIDTHNEIAKNYTQNLRYSEALLGEKDVKMEGFDKVGIRTIHAAMAQTLTLGEIARKTDNELTSTINDEILKHSGVKGLTQANEVQNILENLPKQKTEEINRLKNEKTNLNARLATLQASLTKEGKVKVGEDASARQNRLIDITTEVQETQEAISKNSEQSRIAVEGLGIRGYENGEITFEAFENHEKNVAKFNVFMQDLAKSNPQQYSKMLALLAQKNKSIQHIKNYEKAVDLITNKATRIKTVESWAKKANLKTDAKQFYIDILEELRQGTINVIEPNRQQIENREAFTKDEGSIENVAQSYIDNLLKEDYDGLLKIDQEIVDKYKGEEVASMEAPKEENTEKPIDQLQILRDKVKELTSDVYTTQYIGDTLAEQNLHKPKDSDVEEYETLLKKWNRKAEKSLARIISRPSDYKYKDLGLNEAEIDRLKELNTTLGNWMSFQGINAGGNESVADLLERINALEATINADETHRENTEKDFVTVVEVSEEYQEEKKDTNTRGGQSQSQALRSIVNGNYRWSHTSLELFTSYFKEKDIKEVIPSTLGFAIELNNGKIINATYNSKGGFDTVKAEWDNIESDSIVLIKNFNTMASAINRLIGIDSQGNEQYEVVNGDATYLQTNGSNIPIDTDELNKTKLGETIQLFVSTTDKYNDETETLRNKSDKTTDEKRDLAERDAKYHIYMYRNGKLIGNVPGNYIKNSDGSIDEKEEGVGLPLLQMRKNAKEYVAKQIAEGKNGLIPLPYTLKAGMSFIGQPNLVLQKDTDGNIITKQIKFDENSLKLVVGTGYILNGNIVSNADVQVKQFVSKLSLKNKDKKVPLIIFDYLGKNVAFPVDLISEGDSRSEVVLEMLNSGIDNTEKIKQFIQALTDAKINPNQFEINYTDSENFTTQIELNDALDKLSELTKVVDMEEFAKKTYRKENLPKHATIALQLDGVPFLSSKLMISVSDEITDVSVPLKDQVEELKQQEVQSIKQLAEIAKILTRDLLSKENTKIYENLEGDYTDNLVSEIDIPLGETNFIQDQVIVKALQKATSISNKNLSGENTRILKIPKIVKDRMGKPLLNSLKVELENLDNIKKKLSAIKTEIKGRDLAEKAKEATICP